MRLYIFGPMAKYREEGWNRARFEEARRVLLAAGHEVCSPMVIDDGLGGPDATARLVGVTWLWGLDIQVVGTCEAIVLVDDGWHGSKGSTVEAFVATILGIPVLRFPTLLPIPAEELAVAFLRAFDGYRLPPALAGVALERARQDAKWGEQNHVDGTGLPSDREAADKARQFCDDAFKAGLGAWRLILEEEYREALAETDPAKLRKELLEVAAVSVAWAEAIDRRLRNQAVARASDGVVVPHPEEPPCLFCRGVGRVAGLACAPCGGTGR